MNETMFSTCFGVPCTPPNLSPPVEHIARLDLLSIALESYSLTNHRTTLKNIGAPTVNLNIMNLLKNEYDDAVAILLFDIGGRCGQWI